MATINTTVPPDEQDLESVGTEVLPPTEDAAPAEEDMAAAPNPSREIPVSPDEDSGLAGEGSPDGDAAQEDALLEESDLSRADSPPSGEEFQTAPEEQQAAEDETYGGILQELGGSAPDGEEPLTLEQSDAPQSETEGFSEDEVFSVESVEYCDSQKCGGYGPAKVRMKTGRTYTVDFGGIEGRLLT